MAETKDKEINVKAREILNKGKAGKKITVNDFIKGYENKTTQAEMEQYMASKLAIKDYVSFNEKVGMANMITQLSCLDKDGNIHMNSPKRYQMYIISLFQLYTNIVFDDDHIIEQYDELDKYGIVKYLLAKIPKDELAKYRMYIQSTYDDIMANQYEIHSFINKKLSEYMPKLFTTIKPFTDGLKDAISQIDMDALKEAFNKEATK